MDMKERREYSRIDFSGTVSYEACSTLEPESADPEVRGTAVDLSKSGLCLITRDAVKDKQILKINMPLPGLDLQIPTLAMVMWKRPHNDAYKVGMMFVI